MKKNYKSVLILVILLLFLMLCLLQANDVLLEVVQYTTLFLKRVFPSSFLFLTVSSLLIDYQLLLLIQKILKRESTYFYVFLFSMISGFPSGAFLTKKLFQKKIIDSDTANQIIQYAHFPNPLFVFSSISVVLGNTKEAIILFLSIILSNLVIYLLLPKKKTTISSSIQFPTSFILSLENNIIKSFRTILMIYGISLSFNLIAFSGQYLFSFSNVLCVLFSGLLDLTRGVFMITNLSSIYLKRFFLLLFFSFGSFSIHMQTKSILEDTSICYSNYFLGRVFGFLLSAFFYTLILLVDSKFYLFLMCFLLLQNLY